MSPAAYQPRRRAHELRLPIRGLDYHVRVWGDPGPGAPLVLLHGWMDSGASFQFFVDALAAAEGPGRRVVAPDWRGFGATRVPGADCYWFPDYLADLDALLDRLSPDAPVDLLGHSMGGNVAMSYAGVRPERVRRLVNLEGFGLPEAAPEHAPRRLRQWLDELKAPQSLRDYADLDEVAARLLRQHPRLTPERAAWLAPHWAQPRDGRWAMRADPAHKRVNPILYRRDEVVETWKAVAAPTLWLEGADTDVESWWGDRYPREDFERRLAVVRDLRRGVLADCGHMLHLDQPDRLSEWVRDFLADPSIGPG